MLVYLLNIDSLLTISVPPSPFHPADDARPEADHQQEGAGAAAGPGQPSHVLEPVGYAERYDGTQWDDSDGPAGPLPAAPRPGLPPAGYGQEPRTLQGPLKSRINCPFSPIPTTQPPTRPSPARLARSPSGPSHPSEARLPVIKAL